MTACGWSPSPAWAHEVIAMAEDAFAEALENRDGLLWVKRGLTDDSYKKYVNRNVPGHSDDNFNLATFGDSLLKFALTSLLLDCREQLSKARQEYESDMVLVTVIGKHYRIADYMLYDRNDRNIATDYVWSPKEPSKGKSKKSRNDDNSHKHIATAVEGVLGGIYKEHGDLGEILEIVRRWIDMIDSERSISKAVRHPDLLRNAV